MSAVYVIVYYGHPTEPPTVDAVCTDDYDFAQERLAELKLSNGGDQSRYLIDRVEVQPMAPELQNLSDSLQAARLHLTARTVSKVRQRLGKIEHDLRQLECACRFSGAMPEETRAAFEGVGA